jgi:hypothetical protein
MKLLFKYTEKRLLVPMEENRVGDAVVIKLSATKKLKSNTNYI